MTRNSFIRLERCWRTPSPVTPEKVTACRLHTQQHRHNIHGSLLSHHHRRAVLYTSYCGHSSHIVKSPYENIEIPNKLIPEMIWDTVDRFPDSTAIKCGLTGRAYTFADIQKLSYRFANSLRQAGFKKGAIISLVMPNSPEFAIVTLGGLEAELSLSFVNHSYTADEICHQLSNSGSVCVVTVPEKLNTVLSAVAKVEEKTQAKPIRRVIVIDIPPPESLPIDVVRLSDMIGDNVDSLAKSSHTTKPNDLAFLPYSSGTTGLPKGVCLSHRNIVANHSQMFTVEGWDLKSPEKGQDILLGVLPFYHLYGLAVLLIGSLARGSQIITLPKFEPNTLINALESEKISVFMLVPPLVLFLSQSDKVLPKHLAHLRLMMSAAAPMGESDLEKFRAKLQPGKHSTLAQLYGMTELSPIATIPPLPPKNMATIGMPAPSSFAKIVNPDTGDTLGPNESGELWIKGPQVMLGYHNNPKATSDIIDSEGWLRTGDVAYFDEDKYFYIKDRLKEIIKVKGFQVPPAELEEVLRTHPCVNDVGVIGVPCPRAGETPVAYIVPKKDKKVTVDEIKNFLLEKVSRHKQISEVFFSDSIPRSAAGKILRKDLKKMYEKDHHLS